jgi:hypothetical protein
MTQITDEGPFNHTWARKNFQYIDENTNEEYRPTVALFGHNHDSPNIYFSSTYFFTSSNIQIGKEIRGNSLPKLIKFKTYTYKLLVNKDDHNNFFVCCDTRNDIVISISDAASVLVHAGNARVVIPKLQETTVLYSKIVDKRSFTPAHAERVLFAVLEKANFGICPNIYCNRKCCMYKTTFGGPHCQDFFTNDENRKKINRFIIISDEEIIEDKEIRKKFIHIKKNPSNQNFICQLCEIDTPLMDKDTGKICTNCEAKYL